MRIRPFIHEDYAVILGRSHPQPHQASIQLFDLIIIASKSRWVPHEVPFVEELPVVRRAVGYDGSEE